MNRGGPMRRESVKHAAAREDDSPTRRAVASTALGKCEACDRFIGLSPFAGDAHHVFLTRLPMRQADHPALRVWLCHPCHRDRWHTARPDQEMVDRLERVAVERLTGLPLAEGELAVDAVRMYFRGHP